MLGKATKKSRAASKIFSWSKKIKLKCHRYKVKGDGYRFACAAHKTAKRKAKRRTRRAA